MICLRRSVSFFSGTSDQTQEELVWLKKKERQSMNGLTMMILAVVVLGGAYLVYGRYLAKKWGINPDSKTPAYEMEDGVDYVPVCINCRRGADQRTDSGGDVRMASGYALDSAGRCVLRRSTGFCLHVCLREK